MTLILSTVKYTPSQEKCAHHIIDNIYLGSEDSRVYTSQMNIDRIIQVGEQSELSSYLEVKVNAMSVVLSDNRTEDITKHFQQVFEYIEQDNKNVLIHCKMGVSRSVSFVVAYLILKKKYTYDQAIKLIEEKRNDTLYTHPNTGFMKTLRKL